jgi:hypothetical protein
MADLSSHCGEVECIALLIGLGTGGALLVAGRRRRIGKPQAVVESVDKMNWRMPPFGVPPRPTWSRGRLIGMYALRGYLLIAVVLLAVKAGQLATGH